jgi:hypothetical protein
MEFIRNNSPWNGIVNEIPCDIDNFLTDYFNADSSAVELGDLPLLSPNTLQLLDDFTRELTGNPSPTDYKNKIQTTEIDSHNPIIEKFGAGGGGNNI